MAWFFRCFFLMIGICIVIAAAKVLKDLLSPEKNCKAILTVKARREFPYSLAGSRKNKEEYLLTFRLLSEGETAERTFEVKKKLYEALEKGSVGILTWRGDWLRSFRVMAAPKASTVVPHTESAAAVIPQSNEE